LFLPKEGNVFTFLIITEKTIKKTATQKKNY